MIKHNRTINFPMNLLCNCIYQQFHSNNIIPKIMQVLLLDIFYRIYFHDLLNKLFHHKNEPMKLHPSFSSYIYKNQNNMILILKCPFMMVQLLIIIIESSIILLLFIFVVLQAQHLLLTLIIISLNLVQPFLLIFMI